MASENVILLNQSLCLHFKDVSYTVTDKNGGKPKQILHNVCGQFISGQLAAILGPSGAGKTSLLNVLSGFKTTGATGEVKVNGVQRNVDEFRKQSCYISQDLSMIPQLTTKETLTVAANLKLKPGWEKREETSSVVSNIFETLGLTNTEHTSVDCLSGGERKRLSIGLELISNPPIMFVDEPTSGLDISSSIQVIDHLRKLCAQGHVIVCVIHQPSSRMFNMFDHLYLMSDGQCLYTGPTANMVGIFQEAKFQCPLYYNLADFAIEVACRERGDDLSSLLQMFQSNGQYSTEAIKTSSAPNSFLDATMVYDFEFYDTDSKKSHTKKSYPNSEWKQFDVLLRRSFRCLIRDFHMAQIRLAAHFGVSLLIGVIFYGIGNEASKAESNASYVFFMFMFLFYGNSLLTVTTFPSEMAVLLREHLNNWYSLAAYYWAKLLANIPLQVVCTISFVLPCYFMSDQPSDIQRLLMTMLPCQLNVMLAQAFGLVIGAACDVQLGVFLVPVATIPMFLFSGFFLRLDDMQPYLRWISEISYLKHSFEAIMIAIYGHGRPKMVCSQPYCHHKNPDKLLNDLGMDENSYWPDIGGLVVWIVSMYIILYIVLKWRIFRAK